MLVGHLTSVCACGSNLRGGVVPLGGVDLCGRTRQGARCGNQEQECAAAAAAGLGQSRQPTGGPPLDRGRAPQFSLTQPLWDNQLSASFVFHAPLCLALLQTRRFSFQFQTGRTTMSRPHTHLFHQMTFLSPRPSPPYKELAPLGLIESDQGENCSASSVQKARMVSVPSKAFSQTNSFVRNKSLCSNWAFTCHL